MSKILITGAVGLIGRTLSPLLSQHHFQVIAFDKTYPQTHANYGDITQIETLRQAMQGCVGVINLAAVSRVIWGEQAPELCRLTNFQGMRNVLQVAQEQTTPPWVIFSSSREVYGQPESLPVHEDMPLQPMNVYAHAKRDAENAVLGARQHGLQTAIVRLSNVYGCTKDHADRVVPAFAHAAALGQGMRVDGTNHTFDFTHVSDTVRGILAAVQRLQAGVRDLPPIHLLTGNATTLGQLATLANQLGQGRSQIHEAKERNFDVAKFYGNPTRAKTLLNWSAQISIEQGLKQLIADFTAELITTTEVIA
ncbi:NAD(P)-dependent oxidoreductase [Candidatus Venteria ishoeyi]|uniref:NAD-dependent epimerase/dehydratase family protein n=1 Tax=Candidatus Venteria ishoeyi TaxID=1899563 RepID=UPI0025A51036|nr:NAD(P)-dependent oxidoreductase [Candidatus Venteria ishoeyi]MDM8546190.1 NAD(P)-dependent oxidoreductase [Candidatus Venteria ishoeyi]